MKYPQLPLAVLLAAGVTAGAGRADDSEPYQLEPNLVVTPSRMTEALGEALASVSVITREDIELSIAEDLLELLRLQPGVDIVRTGGAGAQTSVFLRGGNSNHVLVLIDGVRVSSANTGAYVWEQLPLNQIERVEIVRGPRGSLYGSDSIGGVIHVFTRGNPEPYARITGGSYGTVATQAGLGYDGETTRISVNAGYRKVDGFSAQNPDGFSYDPDDDGYRNVNLGVKGTTDWGLNRLRYSVLAFDSESEFDQGVSDSRQVIGSLEFQGSLSPDWDYQLTGGFIRDELFTDFGFFASDFDSRRWELGWQNQLRTEQNGSLSFGIDYYRETGVSDASWDRTRHNTAAFAAYDHRFERVHLQLGGRYDDNSRFGGEFTGQLTLGYTLTDSWELLGSYGTAFRGPTLSEQYSPGFGGLFAGNPDLDPESSASAELGLRWTHPDAGRFSAALYRTDVEELIAFNGPAFQAINIDEARLQGLELAYTLSRGPWTLSTNATLQNTEDRATGESLLRRPDEKASVALDYHFADGSWLGFEGFWSGERLDFGGITLDSYALLNLRAGWVFADRWQLELRGENLGDEDYEPAHGFNAAGRSFYLSVAWRP